MILKLIWMTASFLVALALLVMVSLVVVRLVTDYCARRQRAVRAELLSKLLSWLDGGVPEEEMVTRLRRNRAVGTSLLIEIFELMRGNDQDRLARLAEKAFIPRYLRECIETGTASERLRSAEHLVWFPSPENTAILRFALNDTLPEVSLAAAVSLAQLGEAVPVRGLIESLLEQAGEGSRQLDAMMAHIAPRQKDDLIALAQDEAAPEHIRAGAIDALGRSGQFDALDAITTLKGSPSIEVRAAVVRGLGALGHPDGTRALMELLGDAAWEVRAEAAEAVGRIGLAEAADSLSRLLADQHWWVRFHAGTALARLGEKGIGELKRLAAGSPGEPAVHMAALTLAERGLG